MLPESEWQLYLDRQGINYRRYDNPNCEITPLFAQKLINPLIFIGVRSAQFQSQSQSRPFVHKSQQFVNKNPKVNKLFSIFFN